MAGFGIWIQVLYSLELDQFVLILDGGWAGVGAVWFLSVNGYTGCYFLKEKHTMLLPVCQNTIHQLTTIICSTTFTHHPGHTLHSTLLQINPPSKTRWDCLIVLHPFSGAKSNTTSAPCLWRDHESHWLKLKKTKQDLWKNFCPLKCFSSIYLILHSLVS